MYRDVSDACWVYSRWWATVWSAWSPFLSAPNSPIYPLQLAHRLTFLVSCWRIGFDRVSLWFVVTISLVILFFQDSHNAIVGGWIHVVVPIIHQESASCRSIMVIWLELFILTVDGWLPMVILWYFPHHHVSGTPLSILLPGPTNPDLCYFIRDPTGETVWSCSIMLIAGARHGTSMAVGSWRTNRCTSHAEWWSLVTFLLCHLFH